MDEIHEIKFGLLSEHDLKWLERKAIHELEKRNEKPEEYFEVVYCNDGCEGFYCKKELFHKIPSIDLHNYITQCLQQGSDIRFSIENVEIEQYKQSCARYEWEFDDETLNTEISDNED